jgi:thiol-disulfide isomerase/thioredoxin
VINLDGTKVVVFVFGMEGCPACEHYIPRLQNEATQLAAQGFPFVVDPQGPIAPGAIPILFYDAASEDKSVQQLADRYQVHATPTTIVAARGPGSFKVEGSLANNQIQWLLMMAGEANK